MIDVRIVFPAVEPIIIAAVDMAPGSSGSPGIPESTIIFTGSPIIFNSSSIIFEGE